MPPGPPQWTDTWLLRKVDGPRMADLSREKGKADLPILSALHSWSVTNLQNQLNSR